MGTLDSANLCRQLNDVAAISAVWDTIEDQVIQILVNSMHNRMYGVIRNSGDPIDF